jgi:predicted AAA+ superfamily ATPase
MWPLSFKEFLQFKEVYQPHIEQERQQPFLRTYYDKYASLYEEFIQFGGFPEVVLADSETDKEDYLSDVINSYIELDIKLLSDFEMTDSLYKLMLLLAGRVGSKVDYSKLANIIGLNRHKVKDYISLFEHTYFIRLITPFSRGIDKELTKQPKIYFSDTGILNKMQKGLSSGHVFENTIANQLTYLGHLNYFETSKSKEIDFILNEQITYEVKETPAIQHLNTLRYNTHVVGLQQHHLIGRYPAGTNFNEFIWGGNIF